MRWWVFAEWTGLPSQPERTLQLNTNLAMAVGRIVFWVSVAVFVLARFAVA